MARSSRRPTRVSRLSFIQLIRRGPSSAAKGLLLAALAIAAGVWFWWSPGSRGWFVESLGYGWIPVGIWLAVAITAIVHHRSAVHKSWQWCVAAAALAAISIGVLSLFHTGSGTFSETGLSGSWGQLLGGSPIGLAVAKLAAIALLSPLALLSRPVGWVYWRGLDLRRAGFLLRAGLHIQGPSPWLAVRRPASTPGIEPGSRLALSRQAPARRCFAGCRAGEDTGETRLKPRAPLDRARGLTPEPERFPAGRPGRKRPRLSSPPLPARDQTGERARNGNSPALIY